MEDDTVRVRVQDDPRVVSQRQRHQCGLVLSLVHTQLIT